MTNVNKFAKPKPQSLEQFIDGAPSVSSTGKSEPSDQAPVLPDDAEHQPATEATQADSFQVAAEPEVRIPRKYKTKAKARLELEEKESEGLVSTKYVVEHKQKEALRKIAFEQHTSSSKIVRAALDDWFKKHGIELDAFEGA